VANLGDELKQLEVACRKCRKRWMPFLRIPNMPTQACRGKSEADNRKCASWQHPKFDFEVKDHVSIGEVWAAGFRYRAKITARVLIA